MIKTNGIYCGLGCKKLKGFASYTRHGNRITTLRFECGKHNDINLKKDLKANQIKRCKACMKEKK